MGRQHGKQQHRQGKQKKKNTNRHGVHRSSSPNSSSLTARPKRSDQDSATKAKTSQHHHHHHQNDDHSDGIIVAASDLQELRKRQQDEIDAIQAIFADKCTVVSHDHGSSANELTLAAELRILVDPTPDVVDTSLPSIGSIVATSGTSSSEAASAAAAAVVVVQVTLCVFFTNFYPLKPPQIWFEGVLGLKRHHTLEMQSHLESIALECQGREMVYDLVMATQDYLDRHYSEVVDAELNTKSLFDLMSEEARRKKALEQKRAMEERKMHQEQQQQHVEAMQRELEQMHMKKMINVERKKREKKMQMIKHSIMLNSDDDTLPYLKGIDNDFNDNLDLMSSESDDQSIGKDNESEGDSENSYDSSDDSDDDDDNDSESDSDDAALTFRKRYRRRISDQFDDSDSDNDSEESDVTESDDSEGDTFGKMRVTNSPSSTRSPNYFDFDSVFGSASDDEGTKYEPFNNVGHSTVAEEELDGDTDSIPMKVFTKEEKQQLLLLRLLHSFCEDHLPNDTNAYDDLVDQLLKLELLKKEQSLTDIKTFRRSFNAAFRDQIVNSTTKGTAFSLLWDVPFLTRNVSGFDITRTHSKMDLSTLADRGLVQTSPRSPHTNNIPRLTLPTMAHTPAIPQSPMVSPLSPMPVSRYRTDFEELEFIDKGAFGSVVKARNKLDQRIYAIKKILLPKDKNNEEVENKILREVSLLSRLHHDHIVRYYNAWREENNEVLDMSDDESDFDDDEYSDDTLSSPESTRRNGQSKSWLSEQSNLKSKLANTRNRIMYIQMEFCQTTLREVIDNRGLHNDKEEVTRLFRQILEALTYLHDSDIIHRDLKPANIFFSVGNEVKVGDFGLAVKNRSPGGTLANMKRNASIHELMDDIASNSQSLSTGVGTMIYAAPEILSNSSYTPKVDCYSLGIILLEMLLPPFATGMERYKCLQEVRHTGKVPSSFPMSYEKEREILEWLLHADPNKRPTARQLLERTDLLPVKREEEILSLLFSQKFEDYEIGFSKSNVSAHTELAPTSLNISSSSSSSIGDFSYPLLMRREKLGSLLSAIFTLHGAIRFDMPSCLLPNSDQVNELAEKPQINRYGEKFTPMMFRSGHIVQMSPDIVVPFARYLSRLPSSVVNFIKRYSFDTVIRESAATVGTPFTKSYCSFDIVGSTYKMVTEAEVLLTASQILSCLQPVRGKFVVRFNHTDIIRAVLKSCAIDEGKHPATLRLLSKLSKSNWNYIRLQLIEGLGLQEKSVNRLGGFLSLSGDPVDVREALKRRLFTQAQEALQDIATLIDHFNTWPVFNNDIVFDLSCCNDHHRYSGLMFQIGIQTRKRFVSLGYGGRYDMLVNKFTLFQQDNIRHAVGMCWKFDKLLQTTVINDTAQLLANIRRTSVMRDANYQKTITAGGDNANTLASDILLPGLKDLVAVCSTGKGMLADRMRITYELWTQGIAADFMYDDRTSLQQVKQFAIDHDVRWIVMTQANLSRRDLVKVKYMSPKELQKGSTFDWSVYKRPIEVKTSELVQLLLDGPPSDETTAKQHQSQTRDLITGAPHGSNPQLGPPSLFHITHGKSTSRKQKKHQDEMALKRYSELFHTAFHATKLIVVDLTYHEVQSIIASVRKSQQPDLKQFKHKKHVILQDFARYLGEANRRKSVAIYATEDDRCCWFQTGEEN